MPSDVGFVLGLALSVAVSIEPRVSYAEASDLASELAARQVEIRVTGSPAAVKRTRETAEELFGRLGIRVEVIDQDQEADQSGSPSPPLVVAYIDLSLPVEPRLVILEGQSGRELDRRELPTTSSLETSVEAVTHVIYSVVESLLELARRDPAAIKELSEPKPSPPAEPKAEPASAKPKAAAQRRRPPPSVPLETSTRQRHERGVGVDAGLTFGSVSLGAGRVTPGGGLIGEARWGGPLGGLGVLVMGSVHGSTELGYGGASADLRPIAGRLAVTYDIALLSGGALLVGLGGGVDGYRVEARHDAAGVEVSSRSGIVDPVLSGLGGARVHVAGPAYLTALGTLDVDVAPSRFVIAADGVPATVHEVPWLRPSFWIAASFSFGAPRFADIHGGKG